IAQPGAVRVTVADDPLDLVAAARAGAARAALRDGAAVVPVTAAAGEIREIREIDLVDRYGNRLAKIAVKIGVKPAPADVPAPAPAPSTEPAAPPARDASRAWYAHPVTWAVTTGVLAAAGGIELWIAVDARSELNNLDRHSSDHQYSEASPVLQRLDRAQLGAGVAFGAAAAAAVVGATLWLRDRGEPAVAVSPGAASVAWRARF
ncbi:MAG TPA: hypothetical protein VHW23_27195, partial [Kofleriaceae bacterium]|nr:hypothetical protein [Kofleriaceae bacterium]